MASRAHRLAFAVLLAGCATPEPGVAVGDASPLDCTGQAPPTVGNAWAGDGGPAADGPVAIISVDGLRADAVSAAPADTLIGLACRGAYSVTAQTVMPSLTLPAHASMVSGYTPEQHGLLHDYYEPGCYIEVPTVFGLAVEAGLRTVIIVGKEKLVQLAPPGTYSAFQWIPGGDAATVDAAIAAISSGFDVLFVHLRELDYVGHSSGWMSADYLAQLRETDGEIACLIDALPTGTTVIVTADHGGHDQHHGTAAATDTTIPWIIAGPSVREGWVIGAPVSIMDTAAAAAFVMGLALEPGAVGRPVEEAFAQ